MPNLAVQIAWKLVGTHGQTRWVDNAVMLRHQFKANIWPRVIPTMPAIIVVGSSATVALARTSVIAQLVSTMQNIPIKFVKRRLAMYVMIKRFYDIII